GDKMVRMRGRVKQKMGCSLFHARNSLRTIMSDSTDSLLLPGRGMGDIGQASGRRAGCSGMHPPEGCERRPAGWRAKQAQETDPMKSRRGFLLTLTAGLVAFAVMIAPVIAAELLGVITKVDVAGKKVTVESNDTGKEVEVTTTDATEYTSKKGTDKI